MGDVVVDVERVRDETIMLGSLVGFDIMGTGVRARERVSWWETDTFIHSLLGAA